MKKKQEEILFEIYENGVRHEDCNLSFYIEKIKKLFSNECHNLTTERPKTV